MMTVEPTYRIVVSPGDADERLFRVPRPHLSSFLATLVFNEVADFRVTMELVEPMPMQSVTIDRTISPDDAIKAAASVVQGFRDHQRDVL